MDILLLFITSIVVLLTIYIIFTYNKLVNRNNIVKDQFSQIDVQLKRRFDLIPNLVEIVKGYAGYENETLIKVIEARNTFTQANTINNEINAAKDLKNLLPSLFALSESYPELKANENFLNLQKDLRDTEDKIAMERQFYNDTVLTYNNLLEMFPSNTVAKLFGFKKYEFFETKDKENIEVLF